VDASKNIELAFVTFARMYKLISVDPRTPSCRVDENKEIQYLENEDVEVFHDQSL